MTFKIEVYNHDDMEVKIEEVMTFVSEILPEEEFEVDDFMKLHKSMYKNIYLYYKDEVLIGLISSHFYMDLEDNDEIICYLMVIAIHPDYQNEGIGSRFLRTFISMNNQSDIWIKIHKTNDQSRGFFKKNHFKKIAKKSVPSALNPSFRKPYDMFVLRKAT